MGPDSNRLARLPAARAPRHLPPTGLTVIPLQHVPTVQPNRNSKSTCLVAPLGDGGLRYFALACAYPPTGSCREKPDRGAGAVRLSPLAGPAPPGSIPEECDACSSFNPSLPLSPRPLDRPTSSAGSASGVGSSARATPGSVLVARGPPGGSPSLLIEEYQTGGKSQYESIKKVGQKKDLPSQGYTSIGCP